jgi:hypothetical protein
MQRGQHLREAHTSEVHTSGSTPKHRIATTIQLPTLICHVGPTGSYPHISTASGRAHSLGVEKKHKKRV